MSSCRIEKKIPTCDVDLKLLELLQNLYRSLCEQYLNIDIATIQTGGFSIRLVDDFANETFSSVGELPYEIFSDGINRINVDLEAHSFTPSNYLKIETCLSKDRLFSEIKIYYSGNDARSVVIVIHDKIIQALSTKKNNNYLYNPTNSVGSLVFAISLYPLWLAVPLSKAGLKYFITSFFIMILSWCYLYFGKRLKPYCRFDTPFADRRDKLADWLVKGAFGFVLFTSLMAVGRRAIFGF